MIRPDETREINACSFLFQESSIQIKLLKTSASHSHCIWILPLFAKARQNEDQEELTPRNRVLENHGLDKGVMNKTGTFDLWVDWKPREHCWGTLHCFPLSSPGLLFYLESSLLAPSPSWKNTLESSGIYMVLGRLQQASWGLATWQGRTLNDRQNNSLESAVWVYKKADPPTHQEVGVSVCQ